MFDRILVANRGEIALRVLRACKEMGLETVCIFSEEDRDSTYLELADQKVCVGSAAPADSYLRQDRIIAAAEMTKAQAIHPGYGFLAENAQFAEKCRKSGFEFIGPSAEAMRLLGDKAAARKLAQKAKVPIVPGTEDAIEELDEAIKIAKKVGFPVIIKAAAGGGGRGMRVVRKMEELKPAISQARQEAEVAFGNPAVYIEKFLENPRHVEVQVLADSHGRIVHLYERDCTMQRRHQKLIEESPSPGIDPKTRANLCKWATSLLKKAKYHNAATVEFIGDSNGHFFFMEVNTRIQVEHPVTEMVTGVDLIQWMIRIAAGEDLKIEQKHLRQNGCAMEFRINAEDPDANFRPSAGKVDTFRTPGGYGVRIDTHAHAGYRISPKYDSMIAKLIVHRPTRDETIAAAKRCLSEFKVGPGKTTIPFFLKVLDHPKFISGQFDTGFIERTFM